jgi:hypothetical protein
LSRAAKHLALLACLTILAKANGAASAAPHVIFLIALLASAAHLIGRAIQFSATRNKSRP